MSLFDDGLASAADAQDIQAGGQGFLSDLGDALTAGTAGAVVSGLGSIYNTFAAGANALGADVDTIDTYSALQSVDDNWAEYYKNHQNVIDTAGFIGTSLIPGGIAIKGLNMLRAGEGVGVLGRALGFTRTMQSKAIDSALSEMATEGGTIFTRINKSKLAAMGWGVADQTLQMAAFETGVALTMKQSPLLADDSWWDIGKTAITNAAFGGVIGGGIDSILLNKAFKDTVTNLDNKQRIFDYRKMYEGLNIAPGDKAYGIINNVLQLPEQTGEMAGFIKVPQYLAERTTKNTKFLDVSKVLNSAAKNAQSSAMADFETTLRGMSQDPETGDAVARYLLEKYNNLKAVQAAPTDIADAMGADLLGVKSFHPATDNPPIDPSELQYFSKKIPANLLANVKSVDDYNALVASNAPVVEELGGNAYKQPYIFKGTPEQKAAMVPAFIGRDGENGYANLTAAWADGKHIAILPDGAVRVNDRSPYWQRVDDPVYTAKRYFNTRTGTLTDNAVLTAADRVPAGSRLVDGISPTGVKLTTQEGKNISNKFLDMRNFHADEDVEYYTARHAWAAKLEDGQIPSKVSANDFSLMDRIAQGVNPTDRARINIVDENGDVLGSAADISIESAIKSSKMSYAQEAFADAFDKGTTVDVRELAYKLNADPRWIENVVANRFRDGYTGDMLPNTRNTKSLTNLEGLSLPLKNYLQRENVIANFDRPQQFTELTGIRPDMSWREKRLIIMDQVAMTGGQFVTGEQAWAYRVQGAIQATKDAASAVLGTARANMLPDLAQDAAKLADSIGAGAGFLSSSNASYGEYLRLWAQTSGKLVHQWINEDVAAVVDSFSTVSTRVLADKEAAAEIGIVTNILRSSDEKYIFNPLNPKQLILKELKGLEGDDLEDAIRAAQTDGRRVSIDLDHDLSAEFFNTHTGINSDRVGKRTVLLNSRGMTSNIDGDVVYAPPIDTSYFKHFAFVRPIEGKAFSTSEVAMIFGRDAAELNKRAAMVDSNLYDVITKDAGEKFHKAKGDYDFNLTINDPRINSELRRTGVLNNAFPEVRPENIVEDYLRWHQNQTARLVRDTVETNYAQQVAELKQLGQRYVDMATSRFAGTLRSSKSEIVNPYDDYVKTALDVSKRSEYTLFHQANEFLDAVGTRAYQALQNTFGDAQKGMVTWQEANATAEKYGIKGPYQNAEDFFTANVPRDRNLIKEYISKANMVLATTILRFDAANSLLNIVSTPLLLGTEMASIRNLVAKDSALTGKLNELTTVAVPGQNVAVPSTSKLTFNAIKNFFGPDKDTLLTRYTANGDVKDVLSQYHNMLDSLAMRADFRTFSAGVDKAIEKVSNITGNNWAEQFTRFVSADVMRQLSDPLVDAGKMTLKEQNAYISTFVNRVQGNYITSQRPIAFQGVLGSAIGIFQTYQFNLLQQLLRHVGNGDAKTVATMLGLQTGLFGLNGLPLFEAINNNLIGNAAVNQREHRDVYSFTPQLLGKGLGDWLMYGTVSAFPAFGDKWPALYTRGDINPRNITVLPITPGQIPAIDASTRVVSNLLDMGSKLVQGANVGPTLLQGLEHNSLNRPLAGLAQLIAGQTTTSKGSVISASNDLNLITTAARIAGAKPMDESIALNAQYRMKAYQASSDDRINALGERVKSYLYKGQFPPDDVMDGFMKDYAAAGGHLSNFQSSMQKWAKDANISVVNQLRNKMNSSYGRRLSEIMGGVPLEDSLTAPAAPVSQPVGQ
jgi:hypothetical protein